MKLIRAFTAGILAVSLLGAANPAPYDSASLRSTSHHTQCRGFNGWYHVWNLFTPQTVYAVDSCVTATLITQRELAGNYALYVSLVTARIPYLFPVSLYAMAWQTGNVAMRVCASKGSGIEFVQDNRTGMVLGCRAQ